MKLSRIAAAVTTAALAPAVLIASPAFAAGPEGPAVGQQPSATTPDESAPDQAEEDRKTILAIIAEPMASEYMKEAGRKAIADGPQAMRRFIEVDQHRIRIDDYRVAIARLANDAGPILKDGIRQIFNDPQTLEQLRHFYEVTQYELRDQDNRVLIAQLIDGGGPELVKAGRAALAGTAEDRVEFLKVGQHEARAKDKAAEEKAAEEKAAEEKAAEEKAAKEKAAKEKEAEDHEETGAGDDGAGEETGSGSSSGTGAAATGNGSLGVQGDHGATLAATGTGDSTSLVAGGAGAVLLGAGGLLLAARLRRPGARG
ncbi:ALF repeat-containing protein [Streptomyces sp. bgisy060]|uniref:ALF repeat-containing protein n=1 Tax=Streptomyces sp. bgisy060 TaxID=3413775 RepID=UPI003EBD5BD1